MNRDVIITCAVTGAGDTVRRSPHVPVTPARIAADAIAAARAGAAVVHIHVRDPETAGMGGDLVIDAEDPLKPIDGTDLVNALERLPHVEELLPDICTLDCGSLNFGEGNQLYVSTPDMLRTGAKRVQELGVKPELEIFDTGQLWFATVLVDEGLIDAPSLFQLCMGIPYGAPADPGVLAAEVNLLPEGANFASFAIGRDQLPWVAQSVLAGGHARVGLEDNLYLSRGVKATNEQLTERAVEIVQNLGATVATPDRAREILGLKERTGA